MRDRRLDELAARVANGDALSFELLYSETVDDLYAYFNAQVRDSARAEDLTANVYMKAWTAAKSYRSGSNRYRSWLFTIARNELRDSWRREHAGVDIATIELADPSGIEGQAAAEANEEARRVADALEGLTDEQRQVVILRFFSEQSHAEIARILKKREGAVRAQLLRALRHMRKAMNDAAP